MTAAAAGLTRAAAMFLLPQLPHLKNTLCGQYELNHDVRWKWHSIYLYYSRHEIYIFYVDFSICSVHVCIHLAAGLSKTWLGTANYEYSDTKECYASCLPGTIDSFHIREQSTFGNPSSPRFLSLRFPRIHSGLVSLQWWDLRTHHFGTLIWIKLKIIALRIGLIVGVTV